MVCIGRYFPYRATARCTAQSEAASTNIAIGLMGQREAERHVVDDGCHAQRDLREGGGAYGDGRSPQCRLRQTVSAKTMA